MLTLGLGALLLAGCGDDSTPATGGRVAEPPKPAAPAALLRVGLFLEYSGGMKGFVPAGSATAAATEFQQRVGSLLTETQVSDQVAAHRYFLVYQDTALKPLAFSAMRQVVLGEQQHAALGTELPDMLEAILRRPAASQEVSVIVSDFIYGPQDKAKIPLISDYIRTAVDPVHRQHLAVAVLAERSTFFGTYHPAVKTPVRQRQLRGERIPYYIWVIGPPAQVGRYLAQVPKSLPAEQAYFGLSFPRVPYGAVLTGLPAGSPLMTGGEGSVSQTNLSSATALDVEDVKKRVEFTVGLNLSELPAAWQQPAFLAQQLRATLPGAAVAPVIVPGSVQRLAPGQQATPALAAYTHVLRLRLAALPAGTSHLTLTLAAPEVPAWVAAWSTDNDNLPGPAARTYRLTDIMRGLRGAFPAALPPVFSLPLTLANQD